MSQVAIYHALNLYRCSNNFMYKPEGVDKQALLPPATVARGGLCDRAADDCAGALRKERAWELRVGDY